MQPSPLPSCPFAALKWLVCSGRMIDDVIPLGLHMNEELASNLIEHATRKLERQHASTGGVNLSAVRTVGDAAQLLGFFGFANRCEHFLQIATPDAYWEGVITNLPFDRNSISDKAKKLTPIEQVERDHPLFAANYADSVLTPGMGEHIAPCKTRDYQLAFKNAGANVFQWHEVVVAQALNGDTSPALMRLSAIDDSMIRKHVQLVIAIESFRRGDATIGSRMYDLLKRDGIHEHDAAHMALGIMNRVPWICYPFADY